MAKYSKKKKKQPQKKQTQSKQNRGNTGKILLLVILSVLLALLVWLGSVLSQREVPTLEQGEQPGKPEQSETGDVQQPLPGQNAEPEATEPPSVELPDGLVIHYISSYAGIYMEDGTDEPVSDVMMIVLENTAEQDLQLARISIEYEDFTAKFEVTNLPAGEKVVALEKSRHPGTSEEYLSIQTKNVLFFPEPMGLEEERIEIKGHNGTLEVTNISGEDIMGDIYIYYKNSATDLLYGGITYRVPVRGGLKAGESTTVIAGHYTPDNSRLLLVDCGD